MADFLQALLTTSLYGSVVIGAIFVLRLLLRRAPKKYLCLLWLLAALRLMLPFQVESAFSLQPDLSQIAQQQQNFQPQLPTNPVTTPPTQGPTFLPTAPETLPNPSVPVGESPAAPAAPKTADPAGILVGIWAAVALSLLVYSVISYLRLWHRVRSAVILQEGVWLTRQNTAMVLGFFRPRIYVSAHLEPQQREFVLRHERCHIRRGDHWWKPLGFLVLAIHWFNPLVWLGFILLCRDLEMACDEAVIRDLDLSQRKSYSAALLACNARPRSMAACPVAFGEVSVKERIKNVLHYRKPKFWIILACVLAIALVTVCFLTSPLARKPQAEHDDWGLRLTAGSATPQSVILRFEQTGASQEDLYLYTSEFSLDHWNGSQWVPVPYTAAPTFTKELLALNNNSTTDITLQWYAFHSSLPAGTYRANKIISRPDGESRVYRAEFLVPQESQAPPALGDPNRELSAGDRNIIRIVQQAIQQLRQKTSLHCTSEEVLTGYPPQTGNSDEFFLAGDTWYHLHKVHMSNAAENWSVGNLSLNGTQYRYGHAGHTTNDRDWTPALEHQQSDPVWFLHADLIEERIMTVFTTYTADTMEVTLYVDGAAWESQTEITGHILTFTLDLSWNLLSVKQTGTMLHISQGIEYHVYLNREIRILDTDETQIQQWLDALAQEVRQDNP